jgi:hypothetical protein
MCAAPEERIGGQGWLEEQGAATFRHREEVLADRAQRRCRELRPRYANPDSTASQGVRALTAPGLRNNECRLIVGRNPPGRCCWAPDVPRPYLPQVVGDAEVI